MQFLQTLTGVMATDGQCLPILTPPPGLELLVELTSGQ